MAKDFWGRLDEALGGAYTRKNLASDCGIAINTIAMWKSRKSYPSADIAVKIAKALGVSVEYLITGDKKERSLARIRIDNFLDKLTDEEITKAISVLQAVFPEKSEYLPEIKSNKAG